MAKIPIYEEAPVFKPTSFQTPAPQKLPVKFTAIQNVIDQWLGRVLKEEEDKAIKAQQEAAATAQETLGAGQVAQPSPDIAFKYQEVYQKTAEEIQKMQMAAQSQQVISELAIKHRHEPTVFQQAMEEYTKTQVQSLRKTSPVLAAETKSWLDIQSQRTLAQLYSEKAAFDQSKQAAEVLNSFQDLTGQHSDDLLNFPDEAKLYDITADMHSQIDDMVDNHLISPIEGENLKQRTSDTLTVSFVRGAFKEAIENNDEEGAVTIIDSLEAGLWFEDNERGHALAGQLASELKALHKNSSAFNDEQLYIAKQQLNKLEAASIDGISVDVNEAIELVKKIELQGDFKETQKARSALDTILFAQELLPRIKNGNLQELQQLKSIIDSQVEVLEPSARRAISAMVDKRLSEIQSAYSSNDLTKLGGDDYPVLNTPPGAFQARRRKSSYIIGAEPEALPIYSNNELKQFSSLYETAAQRGDFDTMQAIIARFMNPLSKDPIARASEIRRLGETGGAIWVAAQLFSAGELLNMRDFQQLYSIGKTVNKEKLAKETGIDSTDLTRNDDIMKAIRSIAMDDPSLRDDVYDFAYNVYLGLIEKIYREQGDTGRSARNKALNELSRQLQPFTDVVKFDNNRVLPRKLVPSSTMQKQINEYLNNPEKYFKIPPGIDTQFIRPAPIDENNIGFYHDSMGRFLADPKTGEYIKLPISTAEILPKKAEKFAQPPGAVEKPFAPAVKAGKTVISSIGEAVSGAWNAAAKFGEELVSKTRAAGINRQLELAAGRYGLDPKLLRALSVAVQKTPDTAKGTNRYDADVLAVRPSLQNEVRWDRIQKYFSTAKPGKITDPELRPYAVADVIDQYNKRFKGDVKAVLAAYWEGADVVEQLQKQYKEKWFDHLSLETRQFIKRVENARK